jgi:hypothetical protein
MPDSWEELELEVKTDSWPTSALIPVVAVKLPPTVEDASLDIPLGNDADPDTEASQLAVAESSV